MTANLKQHASNDGFAKRHLRMLTDTSVGACQPSAEPGAYGMGFEESIAVSWLPPRR